LQGLLRGRGVAHSCQHASPESILIQRSPGSAKFPVAVAAMAATDAAKL
jgi:hypothetical protein